jgi:hypothetical protein
VHTRPCSFCSSVSVYRRGTSTPLYSFADFYPHIMPWDFRGGKNSRRVLTPCNIIVGYQRFRGPYSLHLQGVVQWVRRTFNPGIKRTERETDNSPPSSAKDKNPRGYTRVYPKVSGLKLQMVQLSATRCSCVAILWVGLVSSTAIILYVASQLVFIVIVAVYFVMTQSENVWIHHSTFSSSHTSSWRGA